MNSNDCSPWLLSKIHTKTHVNQQGFPNTAFNWFAIGLPANHIPDSFKIPTNQHVYQDGHLSAIQGSEKGPQQKALSRLTYTKSPEQKPSSASNAEPTGATPAKWMISSHAAGGIAQYFDPLHTLEGPKRNSSTAWTSARNGEHTS